MTSVSLPLTTRLRPREGLVAAPVPPTQPKIGLSGQVGRRKLAKLALREAAGAAPNILMAWERDLHLPRCILLNGTSSSGKSTIARELQERLPVLYLNFSIDSVLYALPPSDLQAMIKGQPITRSEYEYDRLVRGFHAAISGLLGAGNRVIVDNAITRDAWRDDFDAAVAPYPCFRVGVMCDIEVARQRERVRRDRAIGTVDREFHRVHRRMGYDLEVDTTPKSAIQSARAITAGLGLLD